MNLVDGLVGSHDERKRMLRFEKWQREVERVGIARVCVYVWRAVNITGVRPKWHFVLCNIDWHPTNREKEYAACLWVLIKNLIKYPSIFWIILHHSQNIILFDAQLVSRDRISTSNVDRKMFNFYIRSFGNIVRDYLTLKFSVRASNEDIFIKIRPFTEIAFDTHARKIQREYQSKVCSLLRSLTDFDIWDKIDLYSKFSENIFTNYILWHGSNIAHTL